MSVRRVVPLPEQRTCDTKSLAPCCVLGNLDVKDLKEHRMVPACLQTHIYEQGAPRCSARERTLSTLTSFNPTWALFSDHEAFRLPLTS